MGELQAVHVSFTLRRKDEKTRTFTTCSLPALGSREAGGTRKQKRVHKRSLERNYDGFDKRGAHTNRSLSRVAR